MCPEQYLKLKHRIYAVAGVDDFDDGATFLSSVEVAELDMLPIFGDGFESADTSVWSATVP